MQDDKISVFDTMDILGTRIHLVQNDDVLAAMERWIAERGDRSRFIVNTGFHGMHVASRDPDFQTIVNAADLFSPDGIAAVWLSRLLGKNLPGRATSAELMEMFFTTSMEKRYRSFFFGDTDETLEALREKLEERFPGHQVAGTYSPPFREHSDQEKRAMIDMINEANPDVLWVGLGLPKQETWIYNNLDQLQVPVAIGVGACFGFYSGKVKRVPAWIGNIGLEWLWRLFAEPKKLWRRALIEGPSFVWTVLTNWGAIKAANRDSGN